MGRLKFSQEYVEKEFQKYNFILDDKYVRIKKKVRTICHCGKEFYVIPDNVLSGHTKSCGHCNDVMVGQKFNNIVIIKVIIPKTGCGGCTIIGKCDCGNIVGPYHESVIQNGHTKSCGHCNDPKIGDKIGNMIVVDVKCGKQTGCKIQCLCSCGNITKFIKPSIILNGHISSCGNCNLRKNGRFTSSSAIKLHSIVENILGQTCKHNYDIKGVGCVDIYQPELKIVIEYDGYYNHMIRSGDRSEKDKLKYKKIIESGYKLLNIKSGGYDIPTEKQLRKILLSDFQHKANKRTITMKSWNVSKNKNNDK